MPSSKPTKPVELIQLIRWIVLWISLSNVDRSDVVNHYPHQLTIAARSLRITMLKFLYGAACVLTGAGIHQLLPAHPLSLVLAVGITSIISIFMISTVQISQSLSERSNHAHLT